MDRMARRARFLSFVNAYDEDSFNSTHRLRNQDQRSKEETPDPARIGPELGHIPGDNAVTVS